MIGVTFCGRRRFKYSSFATPGTAVGRANWRRKNRLNLKRVGSPSG
jgi:hypothetical protein